MSLSIFIAKAVSIVYLSVAIGSFFGKKKYKFLVMDLFSNSGLVYMSGLWAFTLGILIVNFHNVWTSDWRVLITFLGWSALIKGILLIAFPQMMEKVSMQILGGRIEKNLPMFALLIGILFAYLGFMS